jgi:hypothetical protein
MANKKRKNIQKYRVRVMYAVIGPDGSAHDYVFNKGEATDYAKRLNRQEKS